MGFFVKTKDGGLWALSSTDKLQIKERATATTHRVEAGYSITDNVRKENVEIEFSGLITDIVNANSSDTESHVKTYVEKMRAVQANGERVTIIYDEERFSSYPDCVVLMIDLNTDVGTASGYKAKLSFSQIRISDSAKVSYEEEKIVAKDAKNTGSKSESSSNNTEELTETGGKRFTSLVIDLQERED